MALACQSLYTTSQLCLQLNTLPHPTHTTGLCDTLLQQQQQQPSTTGSTQAQPGAGGGLRPSSQQQQQQYASVAQDTSRQACVPGLQALATQLRQLQEQVAATAMDAGPARASSHSSSGASGGMFGSSAQAKGMHATSHAAFAAGISSSRAGSDQYRSAQGGGQPQQQQQQQQHVSRAEQLRNSTGTTCSPTSIASGTSSSSAAHTDHSAVSQHAMGFQAHGDAHSPAIADLQTQLQQRMQEVKTRLSNICNGMVQEGAPPAAAQAARRQQQQDSNNSSSRTGGGGSGGISTKPTTTGGSFFSPPVSPPAHRRPAATVMQAPNTAPVSRAVSGSGKAATAAGRLGGAGAALHPSVGGSSSSSGGGSGSNNNTGRYAGSITPPRSYSSNIRARHAASTSSASKPNSQPSVGDSPSSAASAAAAAAFAAIKASIDSTTDVPGVFAAMANQQQQAAAVAAKAGGVGSRQRVVVDTPTARSAANSAAAATAAAATSSAGAAAGAAGVCAADASSIPPAAAAFQGSWASAEDVSATDDSEGSWATVDESEQQEQQERPMNDNSHQPWNNNRNSKQRTAARGTAPTFSVNTSSRSSVEQQEGVAHAGAFVGSGGLSSPPHQQGVEQPVSPVSSCEEAQEGEGVAASMLAPHLRMPAEVVFSPLKAKVPTAVGVGEDDGGGLAAHFWRAGSV